MKHQKEQSGPFFEIPYYHDYMSPQLARQLLNKSSSVTGVPELKQLGAGGGLESAESMRFLADLYADVKSDLGLVLARRVSDRKFLDERVKACFEFNQSLNRDFLDPSYKTVIGLEDAEGRIVIGPRNANYCAPGGKPIAPLPEHLKGVHVTLFGPPDSAKMSINAMNSYHRKLPGEPAIIEQLLATQKAKPMWGADDEDSKTPVREDLMDAAVNLTACFNRSLSHKEGQKTYALADSHLAQPIKRFPGLALPCSFLFHGESPVPLHLYDFALHLFANWKNPKALTFYVPKLENEEEARYIHKMIKSAESMLKQKHADYVLGSVRLMIVLENPRAILRTHEIMDELHPYFAGASLGWHDYLGSTARLFKEDANYRIPVKADPYIVIKYIKASHRMLADVVGSRGGVKVGGMYGILPLHNEIKSPSFQVTLKGYFKDVITQLKRDLTGFWVAHPDFVRLGLAIVEAWRLYVAGDEKSLFTLTKEIFSEDHRQEIDAFIRGQDIPGLDVKDPHYVRSLLVADIKESDYIANNHPDEIRYNVFQSLQYLTDWLSGNGCVALPTVVEGVPVRVMDDLATAERSRWEVWHELYHGRFAVEDFLKIAHEEMLFIRKDLSDNKKIVQVKWDERTAKWYPVAFKLMLQLMTAKKPVEFATELLLPFTLPEVRAAQDPWAELMRVDQEKYSEIAYIERWNYYFERCGSARFAKAMAKNTVLDISAAETIIRSFSETEIKEAASFHGDIGESSKTLDGLAKSEQKLVTESHTSADAEARTQLTSLGLAYLQKFGFKFLVSAKGKSATELLSVLKMRLENSKQQELGNARDALWQITFKRMQAHLLDDALNKIHELAKAHQITGAQIAAASPYGVQLINVGEAIKGKALVSGDTLFEIASLSKTLGTAFAMEYFASKGIALQQPVNQLLAKTGSKFRLKAEGDSSWADQVTIEHLVSHSALNLHYVKGFTLHKPAPKISDLVIDSQKYGYEPIAVISKPGTKFQYSGAGFMVLEHLIESMEGKSIETLTKPFLDGLGLRHLTFNSQNQAGCAYADGYFDDGRAVEGGRLQFPAFAAGALGSAHDTLKFLQHLGAAYHDVKGSHGVSHDTAVLMLHGRDRGCRQFMGCDMGLGVFVAQMGDNRVAIHQGANEGFRALYLYIVAGPDAGKGFVAFCNADNRGVQFIAAVAQVLLQTMKVSGVNFAKFAHAFDDSRLSQEQIVNLGYKSLVFDAFEPTMPEEIIDTGPVDPLAEFNLLSNAEVLAVSNEKFARAVNLFAPFEPIFDPELFGLQGKIMDSWESVRHNDLDRDGLHMRVQRPGKIRFVKLSTKYHDGNHPQFVRVLGRIGKDADWTEFVPKTQMDGHAMRRIMLPEMTPAFDEILAEMFPDGGFTRLGLYEDLPAAEKSFFKPLSQAACERFKDDIPKVKKPLSIPYKPTSEEIKNNIARMQGAPVDYACSAFGGEVIKATNEHYGPAAQVISPYPPINMFDGMESARSRKPGHYEEVTIKLGKKIKPGRVVLDFKYFVNNNPRDVEILGLNNGGWETLAGPFPVKPFAANRKEILINQNFLTQEIKIRTLPDGGINRVHIYEQI